MSEHDKKLESGEYNMIKSQEEKKEPHTWEEKYNDLMVKHEESISRNESLLLSKFLVEEENEKLKKIISQLEDKTLIDRIDSVNVSMEDVLPSPLPSISDYEPSPL